MRFLLVLLLLLPGFLFAGGTQEPPKPSPPPTPAYHDLDVPATTKSVIQIVLRTTKGVIVGTLNAGSVIEGCTFKVRVFALADGLITSSNHSSEPSVIAPRTSLITGCSYNSGTVNRQSATTTLKIFYRLSQSVQHSSSLGYGGTGAYDTVESLDSQVFLGRYIH